MFTLQFCQLQKQMEKLQWHFFSQMHEQLHQLQNQFCRQHERIASHRKSSGRWKKSSAGYRNIIVNFMNNPPDKGTNTSIKRNISASKRKCNVYYGHMGTALALTVTAPTVTQGQLQQLHRDIMSSSISAGIVLLVTGTFPLSIGTFPSEI
jgi:hypothetical protein